jgi:hypothetical protein
MATTTATKIVPLYSGIDVTWTDTLASKASVTVSSAYNLAKTLVVFQNYSSTASVTITLGVSDEEYSEKGQGAGSAYTLGTAETCVFGGTSFESARFLTSSNTIVFTFGSSTCTVYAAAFELP